MTIESPYYLRITATPDCNLRCPYCNPDGTFTPGESSFETTVSILEAAQANGISKIHWTGGEPTKRRDMVDLVSAAKSIGFTYQAMTTNGVLFNKQAEAFRSAGLTGVSISLDSLKSEGVIAMTGFNVLKPVREAIIKSCGLFPEVVVNMVVTDLNLDEIPDFIQFARLNGGKFIPRFCELQNFGPAYENNPAKFENDLATRGRIIEKIKETEDLTEIQAMDVDVYNSHAEYFRASDGQVIGVIAPYSHGWPCSRQSCSRIRIGPTGVVKSCVYSPSYDLSDKDSSGKAATFAQVIAEKDKRRDLDHFPTRHIPAYKTLRFNTKNTN